MSAEEKFVRRLGPSVMGPIKANLTKGIVLSSIEPMLIAEDIGKES